MQLNEYPQLIANLANGIAACDQQLTQERARLASLLHHIQAAIAFDVELKNEAQRKARLNELTDPLAATEYAQQLSQVRSLEHDRECKTIQLQLYRDTFRIHSIKKTPAGARAIS